MSEIVGRRGISRRTVLRGLGTTLALPLLDAMVPALTAMADTPAKAVPRLGVVYHPNGVIYESWLPNGVGRDFALSTEARDADAIGDALAGRWLREEARISVPQPEPAPVGGPVVILTPE